jgi:hypothetical protein
MTDSYDDSDNSGNDEDVLTEAREAYDLAVEAETENRTEALDDLRFARLGDQWPEQIRNQRLREKRPCLTVNKMPAFIRQVVNDARQNKPSIKVRPVDDDADVHTAEVYNGIIRNIETISNADVAYDTACEHAVGQGFGYFRIGIEYAHDDTFDRDLKIQAIPNPFSVYGDPYSTAADSEDWNSAFVCEWMPKKLFRAQYKGKEATDWDDSAYTKLPSSWVNGDQVLLAEWWKREETEKQILMLSNGEIIAADIYKTAKDIFDAAQIAPTGQTRSVRSWKVTHRLMTGAEILETTAWPGCYIPIIPVYGDEVNVEGKRYFRSLIRDAKDPQRMVNYWRSTATELVALAPRAPWVGPEKAFNGEDSQRWETANSDNHPYLSYAGDVPPQRQPFAGVPAGALQEALNASDDMKAVIGLYDAALGARSNETSGVAISARQREGDVSTFHFIDNLSRGIRHAGRILIDLIPHVYTGNRIVRILGAEGQVATAQLGSAPQAPNLLPGMPAPMPAQPPLPPGQGVPWPPKPPAMPDGTPGVFDLSVGKYDLVVDVGPSYTTRRAEAADQMMMLIKSFPQAAPVIGDLVAKNLDWPGAQEIADRLHKMLPPQLQTGPDGQPLPMPAPPPDPRMVSAQGDVAAEQARVQLEAKRIAQEPQIRLGEAAVSAKADIQKARISAAATIVAAMVKAGSATDQNIHAILGDVFMDAQGQATDLQKHQMTIAAQPPPDQTTGVPPTAP